MYFLALGFQDHPRVGGEKQVAQDVQTGFHRITPAQAGKSPGSASGWPRRRDHPRMGGGKGLLGGGLAGLGGITPAWAGKSQSSFRAVWLHGDHPRMGGEKYGFNQDSSGATGSPPHRRGKVRRIRENLERVGITPAWARKRGRFAERKAPSWDHPRMGGEKTHEQQLRAAYEGSPPRGRGKAWHLSHGLLPCG